MSKRYRLLTEVERREWVGCPEGCGCVAGICWVGTGFWPHPVGDVPEVVDRVGRAIWDTPSVGYPPLPAWDRAGDRLKQWYFDAAENVIGAMREPTEVLANAGERAVDPFSLPTFSAYDAEKVWVAMIDEALR